MNDVAPPPSLNSARKAFARNLICDAARDLFFRQGYAATTFDQIAKAAGTRRTTLYSHFADKAEILDAIGQDYHAGLCQIVDMLSGPTPTRAEIDAWIEALVAYVVRERAPATLLIGLGIGHDTPIVVEKGSARFHAAVAERLPAFARAADPGKGNALVRATAKLILRELSLGCLEAARDGEDGRAILIVVADLFERFVQGQRSEPSPLLAKIVR